jgi:hypothetical protein
MAQVKKSKIQAWPYPLCHPYGVTSMFRHQPAFVGLSLTQPAVPNSPERTAGTRLWEELSGGRTKASLDLPYPPHKHGRSSLAWKTEAGKAVSTEERSRPRVPWHLLKDPKLGMAAHLFSCLWICFLF